MSNPPGASAGDRISDAGRSAPPGGRATVAVPDPFAPDLVRVLREAAPDGWTMLFAPESGGEVDLSDADVIFAMWAPVTPEMIRSAPRLALIQKLGAGIDRIDLAECRRRGIAVAKLAGINAVPVAEHVVLMMLAALRRLPYSDERMRTGEWFKEEARAYQRELRGRTVGLVGMGNIGREVAARLAPFGATVRYHDVVRLAPEVEDRLGLSFRDLDDLIENSDIVSLHVPLLDETRHLIDRGRIRSMRPGAIVVNCARGGLIDEEALREALEDGHLGAACLDTFEEEPLGDLSILGSSRIIATPHSAGATRDNFVHVAARAVENAAGYLSGRGLPAGDAAYVPEG